MKKWIYVYLVIIFTVLGIGVLFYQHKISGSEVVVPGTVVDYKRHTTHDRKRHKSTTYAEVISFELNGQTHHFTRGASSGGKPTIGRVREVAVDPAHPAKARVRMSPWLEKIIPQTLKQYPFIPFLWLFGCVFFGFGWFWSMGYYEFFRRAIKVPGTVSGHSRGAKGGYFEIVSFELDGQERTVRSTVSTPWEPKIGTRREVGIDPGNIQKVRLKSGLWFGLPFAFGGLLAWAAMLVADKFH